MSESHHYTRETPRQRHGDVTLGDLTLLVRVPGYPERVRALMEDERDDADEYSAVHRGTVVPLPLPPPAGYTTGPDGNLVPLPSRITAAGQHPEGEADPQPR